MYQLGQFTERRIGGTLKNDRVAFDLYLKASHENYPPADVALARIWLSSPEKLPRPAYLVERLKDCIEMRCEGAEMTLAELHLRGEGSPETKRKVLSLYRCAAAYGDVDAQMKLARLLAGNESGVLHVQVDPEEAERWYQHVCGSEYASPGLVAEAQLELAHMFMRQGKYAQSATHFFRVSTVYTEAAQLQMKCERYADLQFFRRKDGLRIEALVARKRIARHSH